MERCRDAFRPARRRRRLARRSGRRSRAGLARPRGLSAVSSRATRQPAPASSDERPGFGRLHHGVCGSRLATGVGECRGGATPQDRRRSAAVVSLPGRPRTAARRCRVLAPAAGAGHAARSPAAAPDRGCAGRGSRRRRAARLPRPPGGRRAFGSTRTCSANPCSATPRPRRRLEATIALLQRDDVDYVSVKASSVASQLNLWAYDHTLERVKASLRPLFAAAAATSPPKFVNLDMEEYKDLRLTIDAFTQLLDEPEFAALEAGIVLQAYLPDSFDALRELHAWAAAPARTRWRRHQGAHREGRQPGHGAGRRRDARLDTGAVRHEGRNRRQLQTPDRLVDRSRVG